MGKEEAAKLRGVEEQVRAEVPTGSKDFLLSSTSSELEILLPSLNIEL